MKDTIKAVPVLTLTTKGLNPTCLNNDGKIDLTVSKGTITNFAWSNSSTNLTGNGIVIASLAADKYTVTATLANTCKVVDTITLIPAKKIILTATPTSPLCIKNDGKIDLQTSESQIATYTWTSGTNTKSGNFINIKDLESGVYKITATLISGCTVTTTSDVLATPALDLKATATNPICIGTSSGTVILTIGKSNVASYVWSDGTKTGNGNGANVTGLTSGNYTFTVTVANGCVDKTTTVLADPKAITSALKKRSEERRVGKECSDECISRWSPYH